MLEDVHGGREIVHIRQSAREEVCPGCLAHELNGQGWSMVYLQTPPPWGFVPSTYMHKGCLARSQWGCALQPHSHATPLA